MSGQEDLRGLPAVHRLLQEPLLVSLQERFGRMVVTEAAQTALARARTRLRTEQDAAAPSLAALLDEVCQRVEEVMQPGLREVINATGVVIHTNLGRAPLAADAAEAVRRAAQGYSDLEFDLVSGGRGDRGTRLNELVRQLTGAEAALVVNNNAGAVLLALSALAKGQEVVVSRGELVEIGGSFRVPEVMEQSGARLVEVGATNRTHLRDYERAIGSETALLLKVHRSNFHIEGFTSEVMLPELARLGRQHEVPVFYDLGSGALVALAALGLPSEPTVGEALASGADLVSFSGDKLLGGPQAGILAGRADLIARCRRHPLYRALRAGKLTIAALTATLQIYLQEAAIERLPALAMLAKSSAQLAQEAEDLERRIASTGAAVTLALKPDHSRVGGGSLPQAAPETTVVAVRPQRVTAQELADRLRSGRPPVIGRLQAEELLLDPRTLLPAQREQVAQAIRVALAGER